MDLSASESQRDRVSGVLMGLAAGDRIGGPIRMALQLAESLLAMGRFDPGDVLQHYLRWWQAEGFDAGSTAETVFTLIGEGTHSADAPARVHEAHGGRTAGCNPAHRSPPLAMAYFLPDSDLPRCARIEAALTHLDLIAGDVAAASVSLCRALIRGADWPSALQIASSGRLPVTAGAIADSERPPQHRDGYAPHVLHAAVHFVGNSSNFSEAIQAAVVFAGSSNYCPVLAGAIGGARWGAASIDENELAHCDVLPQVQGVVEKLAEHWG